MALVKVQVTRAFCIKGKRIDEGKVIEVENALAIELEASGKVTFDVKSKSKNKKDDSDTGQSAEDLVNDESNDGSELSAD